MNPSKVVFGHSFAASPLNRAPVQQIVGTQAKRALQGAVRRIFHDTVGKEANHHSGDDMPFMASEEEHPVVGQCEGLLELVSRGDWQRLATTPVYTDGVIGRNVVEALSRLDRNTVFNRFLNVRSFVLR